MRNDEDPKKDKTKIPTEPGTGGQNDDWPGDRKPITPENEPPDAKVPLVR
jgi:hypothetical protein